MPHPAYRARGSCLRVGPPAVSVMAAGLLRDVGRDALDAGEPGMADMLIDLGEARGSRAEGPSSRGRLSLV